MHDHGHEPEGWGLLEEMGVMKGGRQRGKNWDNCNSIINKIYFKKRKFNQIRKLLLIGDFEDKIAPTFQSCFDVLFIYCCVINYSQI